MNLTQTNESTLGEIIENSRHQSPQGFIPTKLLDMAKAPLTSLIWT